ncbi:D-glycerate dehydrogenase [Marinococcus sp. PL1-022]|uniref:2-hydroxyacid dehydrogenase n=1 Tax=Marinococcus sp. PL1-022 TaxID=3095363 RepID=UPI0029C3EF21|nr:D-glycerate dehydrogenase [Marinococcus sp. PL1-022]MDX6152195.1 D-glycerate dehydrogenase [Marinococcus sp. PL1-022]
MTKPHVFVTRPMPHWLTEKLEQEAVVDVWDKNEAVPEEELVRRTAEADGLFCTVSEPVTRNVIEQAPRLKIIATMAVGYNNIDLEAAEEKGVKVAHTPGILTETTADLTFALLMTAARRLPEAMDTIRQNEWGSWAPFAFTGQDIYGATLGIIGMGRIGEAVAKRAGGFDMNILYHNRSRKREAEERTGAVYAELNELLEQADFICVLAPATPETEKLINAEAFRKMKKSAVFINTSRGTTVDEQALVDALREGEIFSAGLDVFENEPIGADHPLLSLSNVVVLPHIGSASEKTRREMADMTADHILQGLQGLPLTHEVPGK